MSAVHEQASETRELMWTLDILQSFVDESEQHFFAHVVNDRFKNYFSINTPIGFDTDNKRILIAQPAKRALGISSAQDALARWDAAPAAFAA